MPNCNAFMRDMIGMEGKSTSNGVLWRACRPISVSVNDGAVVLNVPFQPLRMTHLESDGDRPTRMHRVILKAYGSAIVRAVLLIGGQEVSDQSPMLEWHTSLTPEPLTVVTHADESHVVDSLGVTRALVRTANLPESGAKEESRVVCPDFDVILYPDGVTAVPFTPCDWFMPHQRNSTSLAYLESDNSPIRTVFSVHADMDERFAGTGERFAKMDLAGKTLALENVDALGVNNHGCYKNVPFYVSSRPYGLFIHTSAHIRLSLADISTRSVQGSIDDSHLDLFCIGGGSIERVVYNYRRVTGFPRKVPLWSLGMWMSRCTYDSEAEVEQVAEKLRDCEFPCDVLHIDTGWFDQDWKCDWKFGSDRFPDPESFIRRLRDQGYRVSLWQLPYVDAGTTVFAEAKRNGYLASKNGSSAVSASNLSSTPYGTPIDFTNSEALEWYQGLLRDLHQKGASVIKADFGEEIDMEAEYRGLPAHLLHNLYGLLYQRAVHEATERATGDGIIWARAGWAGSQRYPVHWGGDSSSTWEGLAGSIRGGLHIGVSGFGFWSHDVGGFYGMPNFGENPASDELYVRWTQVGVFTSHMRYHGRGAHEPYERPEAAGIVRNWLRLRYALIPYIREQAESIVESGMPMLRAMIFHNADDSLCWHTDDQYYFGDSFLVAPILNETGERSVYLPSGTWTDFWTGERIEGPTLMKGIKSPLSRMPIYAVADSRIAVYPEAIRCTDDMDLQKSIDLTFDSGYNGLENSVLGRIVNL